MFESHSGYACILIDGKKGRGLGQPVTSCCHRSLPGGAGVHGFSSEFYHQGAMECMTTGDRRT